MSSRLRRPFHAELDDYHNEDDESDDESIIPLDEQEQEELIAALRLEDERKNAFFLLAFTLLALLPILLVLIRLLSGNGSNLDILSFSSLCMSLFTIRRFPITSSSSSSTPNNSNPSLTSYILDPTLDYTLTPLERYIPILNPILIVVITFASYLKGRQMGHLASGDFYGYMPVLVWSGVTIGRMVMGSVDVGSLERLRYGYKGA